MTMKLCRLIPSLILAAGLAVPVVAQEAYDWGVADNGYANNGTESFTNGSGQGETLEDYEYEVGEGWDQQAWYDPTDWFDDWTTNDRGYDVDTEIWDNGQIYWDDDVTAYRRSGDADDGGGYGYVDDGGYSYGNDYGEGGYFQDESVGEEVYGFGDYGYNYDYDYGSEGYWDYRTDEQWFEGWYGE